MSQLRFVPDLFLEVVELERFRQFLDDNGFRKNVVDNSVSFGLIKNNGDLSFSNGRVERDLDNALNQKTIKINALKAINSDGLFIVRDIVNNIPVPADNNWYWVRIKHQYLSQEKGNVSIDAAGNLTGVGTEFTKIFRGMPNFPTRVRLLNSINNTLEYDVLEVTDDTHAVLVHPSVSISGNVAFAAENNLAIQIIGTFTPGVAIPSANKTPFQYDSCSFELIVESIANTRPSFVEGQEFYLARVKVINGNLVIQDKRIEYWETKGSDQTIAIDRGVNPLIGVEAIKWQNLSNTGDRNIVELAWGMRSTNWSVDSSQNIVTLFGSSIGGSFKTIDDFTDGDFNGWRLYTTNGKYARIINSLKQGSAINCYVDVLDVDNFSNDGGTTFTSTEVLATPDCDEVEIKFIPEPTDNVQNVLDNDKFTFPVNTPIARCLPTVYKDPTCLYNIQYRYKANKEFSEWRTINPGKYYTEASFKDNGELKPASDRVEYIYSTSPTAGFVQLTISPNAYKKFQNVVFKGDIIGVNTISNFSPGQVLELKVNIDKRYQYITGNISLTDDVYISLSSTGAVAGNEFRIHFECESLTLGEKKILILDNYSGGTLNIVKELTQADMYQMLNQDGGIVINCVFDDNGKWIAYQNYDLGEPFAVKMFSGNWDTCFNADGAGKVKGWYGHQIMNGQNGTDNIEDRFIVATGDKTKIKTTDGSDQVVLNLQNIPPHDHAIYGKVEKRSTGQGFDILQVYTNGPAGGGSTAPTGKAGGMPDGSTKPIIIKPKSYALAYVQKQY